MNKPKGKQATRGAKQILEENQQTLKFYFNVLAISNVAYLVIRYFLFWNSFTFGYMFLYAATSLVSWIAYYMMKSMGTPEKDENGHIIGPGSDLNMQGHVAEYFKDFILFPSIIYLLTLISNYFWLLLIAVPVYGFYLLWKNFLGPWFFAPAPPDEDEKEQKKVKEKKKIVRVK